MARHRVRQDPVELRRWARRRRRSPRDVQGLVEDPADALAGQRADGEDGREVQEGHLPADALDVLVERLAVLLDEVPLVDGEDEADALLDDVAGDVRVLRGQPVLGVEDEHADVRPADGLEGTHGGVALGGRTGGDLAAPPQPGGVDEAQVTVLPRRAACRWRRASCPGCR